MSEVTKLHVFEQLKSSQQDILDRTSLLASKQGRGSVDSIIKEAMEISKDIQTHFYHEDSLIDQIRKHPDVQDVVGQYDASKDRINQTLGKIAIGNLDKTELGDLIRKLLGELRVFSEFEELKLYKRVGRYASAAELDAAYQTFSKSS